MEKKKYNLDVSKLSKEDWSLNNCKERSIYILTNYSKTEKQLRDKLKQSGKYTPEIIDKTIAFLKEHNFLNDKDFANRFIELHKNAYSKKVIRQKLLIKGIKKEILDEVFADNEENIDETQVIKRLLLKKCPDYYENKDNMDIKAKQKIYSFLMRKGFPYNLVSSVMKVENI